MEDMSQSTKYHKKKCINSKVICLYVGIGDWVFWGLESDFSNGLPYRLWRLELRPETIVNKTGN